MTIFDRLSYTTLDRPFVAASIIGGMAAGAIGCAGYLNRIGTDNILAAAMCAGLAVGTVVSIPLVITRSWILLKTLPWADRPRMEVRPDYPELHTLTYEATATIEPGLRPLPRNLVYDTQPLFPAIDRHKLHRGFQVAMRHGMVSVRKMEEAGYNEQETRTFRDWLFSMNFAEPYQGGAAKLTDAGKEYMDRYSPTARGYRA